MGEDHEKDQGPRCPNCGGNGWIVLLVSRVRCRVCRGTGSRDGEFDGADDETDDGLEFDDEDTPQRGAKKRSS